MSGKNVQQCGHPSLDRAQAHVSLTRKIVHEISYYTEALEAFVDVLKPNLVPDQSAAFNKRKLLLFLGIVIDFQKKIKFYAN